MKCVAVGDVFITERMMKEALQYYKHRYTDVKTFFFGVDNRKEMRDVVKNIEMNGPTSFAVPSGLEEEIVDADILMVHLCPITKDLLTRAKKLKVILCNRGGCENIDIVATKELGIKVLTNPAHNANAVAEFTIGLMISELRNINRSNFAILNGIWREDYPNSSNIKELCKMTVGLIGFGSVGKLVAEKLSGFKCRILVYDPYVDNDNSKYTTKVEFVSLKYLLNESDMVSLHIRCRDRQPIITKKELSLMKSDAYLINTARSYAVDMNDLYEYLENRKICGAAIDVFEVEPLPSSYKFLHLDNVTLTNHRGGDTINAYSDSPLMMLREVEKDFNKK